MRKKLRFLAAVLMIIALFTQSAVACTIMGVGKEATADGSTIVTHTDDTTSDDFRTWIIPRMEGGEGVMRDIVMNGHSYGDWSDYPNTKDYGSGMVIGEMPQPEDTNQYIHSNYSFINEHGVAMGESTAWFIPADDHTMTLYEMFYMDNNGIIDCYHAQHIVMERATTAREAVEIIGAMVEEYGWGTSAEVMNICDGNEVWILEVYGRDLWCAVRLPDNAFFVAANRCRINEFDFEDKENYLCSPNLKSCAIEKGLWSEESGEPFQPAQIYCPYSDPYCNRREWRALSLVAPSLNLDPNADIYPLYVIPEKKLSVEDIRALNSDYYQGTEYDVSLTPEAGPFGNPLSDKHHERTINLYRTAYLMIANVNASLPQEVRPLVWHGFGAPDSSFIVPLWGSMTRLPELYSIGTRYDSFDRNSGWWIASYVQQTASQNYDSAIEDIHAARDPKLAEQYQTTADVQAAAAALAEAGNSEAAIELITSYACNNAQDWYDSWLEMGDELYAKYMFDRVDMNEAKYPQWWSDVLDAAPDKPVEAPAE